LTLTIILFSLISFSQPKIFFKDTLLNVDTILYNSSVRWELPFTNSGNEPLIIRNCKYSGGLSCNWPKDPIYPGKTGKIIVSYYTRRLGPFNKTITLTSNSVTKQTTVIVVKGFVKSSPKAIINDTLYGFGDILSSIHLRKSFEIVNKGNLPLIIERIEPENILINLCSNDIIYPNDTAFFEFKADTILSIGRFRKQCKVYTNLSVPEHDDKSKEEVKKQIENSPIIFDTKKIRKTSDKYNVKLFIIECTNSSNDTIEIYKTAIRKYIDLTKKQDPDFFWIEEGKMRILPPQSKKKIVFKIELGDEKQKYMNVFIYSRVKGIKGQFKNNMYINAVEVKLRKRVKPIK